MPRLAWFTPLPPTRSGIAAYNAELLPRLADDCELEVFADPSPGRFPFVARPAHEFAWRHLQAPYDLVVYQLGNAACHDFIWPHLARHPGLVVLHDGQLHHARARLLLTGGRLDDYRAEFRYNHPDAPPGVAELVIAALAGSIYYVYPMLRWVLASARLVAVHSPGLAEDLRERHPGVEVHTVRHGMGDPWQGIENGELRIEKGETGAPFGREMQNAQCRMPNEERSPEKGEAGGPDRTGLTLGAPPAGLLQAAAACRRRLGIPGDAVLFGAFGLVTPEKRVGPALRALAAVAADLPSAHLLLAGGAAGHYDPIAEARALGLEGRVHLSGYVPDEELPAWVQAADVCLGLRWPTGGETSGVWLRAIAAGKPTIVTDLAHAGQVPSLEPEAWTVRPASLARPATPPDPVSVSIDILDEERLLALAMRRLAADAGLRETLGRAARRYWALHHTMGAAVDDYRRVIARALERPVERRKDLPAHLAPDPLAPARALAGELGVKLDRFLLP